MTSTDITGEPLLILGVKEVGILLEMLDRPDTVEHNRVMGKLVKFLSDPKCIKWGKHENIS